MKTKRFWRFFIAGLILFGLSALIPVKEFIKLCIGAFDADIAAVVPFMAVTLAVWIGFLILPLTLKMPPKRARIGASAAAGILFVAIEVPVEYITTNRDMVQRLMLMRRMLTPQEMAQISIISPEVKIHYYIFSIILILLTVDFLYSLAQFFLKNENANKRLLLIHGLATVFYAIAYIFVKVMQYEDFRLLHITPGSVFNASACIALASIAVGLFSGSYIKMEGPKRLLPSAMAALTAIALYIAEYFMLGGNLYSYGAHFLLAALPVVGLSITHIAVILLPAAIVYLILRIAQPDRRNAVP